MIYLDCLHSDGCVSTNECENWAVLAFALERARDIYQLEKVNVTENKSIHEEKVREWLTLSC